MKKTLILVIASLIAGFGLSVSDAAAYYSDGANVDIKSMISERIPNGSSLVQNNKISHNSWNNQNLVMYRVVRNCDDHKFTYGPETSISGVNLESGYVRYGQLNRYDMAVFRSGGYYNYTCGSRYQQQCINDGSFDTYYEEFCTTGGSSASNSASNSVYGSPSGDSRSVEDLISATYGSSVLSKKETKNLSNHSGLTLYRVVRDCATRQTVGTDYSSQTNPASGQYVYGRVQKIQLDVFRSGGYYNHTCGNRYQEQCINDGSFDTYYEELCTRDGSVASNNNSNVVLSNETRSAEELISATYGSSVLAKKEASNLSNKTGLTLYRVVRDCATNKTVSTGFNSMTNTENGQYMSGSLQKMQLDSFRSGSYGNYTCGSRYREQCINDGSFDTYYEEVCTRDGVISSGNATSTSASLSGDTRSVENLVSSIFGSSVLAKKETSNLSNNSGLTLYRVVRDCATRQIVGTDYPNMTSPTAGQYLIDRLQKMQLDSFRSGAYYNYTCGSRYQQQCINDGSFDTYYEEVCTRN